MERFRSVPIPPAPEADWSLVPPPRECGEPLVDITGRHPRVRFGAAYLTQGLPGALERCLVRQGVWERLERAVALLPERYSLLVFDGLRPLAVQKALYGQVAEVIRQERPGIGALELEMMLEEFVEKPLKRAARPVPHTTGGAVDLTLCLDGAPLEMGTGYDAFTALSHTDWYEGACAPGEEMFRDNRRLLYHVMRQAGFASCGCEWWHYGYGERMWAREQGCAPIYGFCPECDF